MRVAKVATSTSEIPKVATDSFDISIVTVGTPPSTVSFAPFKHEAAPMAAPDIVSPHHLDPDQMAIVTCTVDVSHFPTGSVLAILEADLEHNPTEEHLLQLHLTD